MVEVSVPPAAGSDTNGVMRRRPFRPRLPDLRTRGADLAAIALLAVATVAVWGRPVLSGFGHLRLSNPGDSASFEFYLAWNVHALLNGHDPFFTSSMYAPEGMDLGNAISVPAVSILVSPVTLAFGPTAGYNVAFLLAIFLSALAVYLLARELFGSVVGAALAGLLVVVSPYQTGHAIGHLNMMWVFGLPLLAFLMVRFIRGRLKALWLVAGTSLVVAFTIGASTELFVTQSIFALIGIGVAALVATPAVRRELGRATGLLTAGVIVGTLLGLPVIVAGMQAGVPDTPANPPALYSTDLTNLVTPTDLNLIGDGAFAPVRDNWLGNSAENTAYIPATLLVLLLVSVAFWSDRRFRALLVYAAVTLILSLGPYLTIAGKQTIEMPWSVAQHIPGLEHALPVRFSAFLFMAVALMVAGLWASRRVPRWLVGGAAGMGFILALPNIDGMTIPVDTTVPAYIADGGVMEDVDEGENVLVLPPGNWGPGLRWMERTGFDFTMPTGNGGGAAAPDALRDPTALALFAQELNYPWRKRLPEYLADVEVDTILIDPVSEPWRDTIESVYPGIGRLEDGVWVYELGDPVVAAQEAQERHRPQ